MALPREAGPDDPEPKRFQVAELPPLTVEVIEYQAHGRTCRGCGHMTQATIPAEIREHSVEPSHREALEAVRQAEVKYADETSWNRV